ncbi:MAG: hypothetical protein WAL97_02985 [Halobacteriota archaeon]|jgi:hypothetical protein
MVAYSQFALRGGTNIKSGRGIYDSHKLQLAAYAHAFAEVTGRYPDAGFVLYTNAEKGKISRELRMTKEELKGEFEAFVHIRQTSQRLYPTNYEGLT